MIEATEAAALCCDALSSESAADPPDSPALSAFPVADTARRATALRAVSGGWCWSFSVFFFFSSSSPSHWQILFLFLIHCAPPRRCDRFGQHPPHAIPLLLLRRHLLPLPLLRQKRRRRLRAATPKCVLSALRSPSEPYLQLPQHLHPLLTSISHEQRLRRAESPTHRAPLRLCALRVLRPQLAAPPRPPALRAPPERLL